MSRIATIVSVAVVAAAGTHLLANEGIEHAPLKVLGAGLIASGLVALLNRA
ncbi:hypothetical protein MKK69_30740 [Methylobacterium sp. J-026]|uniref:hypothetical protein n=1 Tax=Methylobacterium sp. J-026 TaxID=2836624 RepID=UPI001FB9398D|nr:hypothetical protein [Methylobacterium sp. J-026]MCJ2138382.1 hypothetical protein [Methylobacterium sp. J-026]